MDILQALPQLVGVVEKLGVAGVLLLGCVVLVWEIRRGRGHNHELRNELHKTYGQRDRARLAYMKCKAILEAGGAKVDLTDIDRLVRDDEKEEAL